MSCLGGLAGSLVVHHLDTRWGQQRALWRAALLRGPWPLLIPLARPGLPGLALVTVGWFGLLLFASVYNTLQTTYRQQLCPPAMRGRVHAAAVTLGRIGKVLAPVLGGLTAQGWGLRPALLLGGLLLCLPPFLLDRGRAESSPEAHRQQAGTSAV